MICLACQQYIVKPANKRTILIKSTWFCLETCKTRSTSRRVSRRPTCNQHSASFDCFNTVCHSLNPRRLLLKSSEDWYALSTFLSIQAFKSKTQHHFLGQVWQTSDILPNTEYLLHPLASKLISSQQQRSISLFSVSQNLLNTGLRRIESVV